MSVTRAPRWGAPETTTAKKLSELSVAPDQFEFAYRLGYGFGFDVGYGRAEDDMERAWHAVWVSTRAVLQEPTSVELARRREPTDDPCGALGCRGCSRCVRAKWVGWRVAAGLPRDWPGVSEPVRSHRS